MQRKPGFPVANCNIKMPDCPANMEHMASDEDNDHQQRRLQLINFGHGQWGFNNWSWSVTKQELDFVDFANGKYCAGVVAFVSITVKSFDIHRENIGYATSVANSKGMAIYKSRKCAVTNALRETLLSFGGSVATELAELGDVSRGEVDAAPEPGPGPGLVCRPPPPEPRNSPANKRKEVVDSGCANTRPAAAAPAAPLAAALSAAPPVAPPTAPPVAPPTAAPVAPSVAPPVVRAHPMPAATGRAPTTARAPPPLRPNSNVSFVLQPVVGGVGVVPPVFAPAPVPVPVPVPRPPVPFPNYYECGAPWHFACEPAAHANLNVNFSLPPRAAPEPAPAPAPATAPAPAPPPCWIKPTIFYDGFWTEQKVKKWVAEQVEKRFPEEAPAPDVSAAS